MDVFKSDDELNALAKNILSGIHKIPLYKTKEQADAIRDGLKAVQDAIADRIMLKCKASKCRSKQCPVLADSFFHRL